MAETVNDYIETDLGNVAPNPKGEYNGETVYEYLDLVTYLGGSYLCTKEDGTISGIAPEAGKNTEYWQNVAIPGDLTPEYIAMHDDVVNKAESVSADAQAVADDREQVESMKENVSAMQEQTAQDSKLAREYRESAGGYASAAETSRNYAAEAEENIRALTSGFDAHVAEKKQDAEDAIEKNRKSAIQVIASQQVISQNAVAQEGQKAIEQTQSDATATAADRAAVSEMANTVNQQAGQVATNTAQVSEDKTAAENAMQSAQESKNQALDAAESVKEAVELIHQNANDLAGKAPVIVESITSQSGKPVQVNDSADMPLQGMKLYGKSTQKTTMGKNIAEPRLASRTTEGVTYTRNKDGSYTIKGTAQNDMYDELCFCDLEEGKQYTVSGGIGGSSTTYQTYLMSTDGTAVGYEIKSLTFVAGENDLYFYFAIYKGSTVDVTIYPMCNEGSTALPFEPYTGGKPSPSPEYPQEIENIGDVGVKVTGKNLIPNDASGSIEKNGVTFTVNDDGTVLVNGTATNRTSFALFKEKGIERFKGKTIKIIGRTSGAGVRLLYQYQGESYNPVIESENTSEVVDRLTVTKEIVANKQDNWELFLLVDSGVTVNNFLVKPMITTDLDATYDEFEPYVESTATIPFPNGLPGIPVESGGNYTDETGQQYICDEVDFERGKYIQRIKQIILDGSSDEYWDIYSINKHTAFVVILDRKTGGSWSLANNFRFDYKCWDNGVYGTYCGHEELPNVYFTTDENTTGCSIETFRTWLASHPIDLTYALATPIETDLTESQLQAYKSLKTHKPTSIISNDAGAQMGVDYAADTKLYIDKKFGELATAIVASASEAE